MQHHVDEILITLAFIAVVVGVGWGLIHGTLRFLGVL